MRARLSIFAFGVFALVACVADRGGLGITDGGGSDGQFDGGFMCPTEDTFDLDGDGRCECTFSSDVETCDGIDNDCDPSTPDGASDPIVGTACDGDDADFCEDGFWGCAEAGYECDEPSENDEEICDGVEDDDCDGTVDEGCPCTTGDTRSCGIDVGSCERGLSRCEERSDCEGDTPSCWAACDGRGPSEEICNGEDDDCDGSTDEALMAGCWVDADSDTYAAAGAASRCLPAGGCSRGFTARRPVSGEQDCNDGASRINPGAAEVCDGVDQDCDREVDEGIAPGCWTDVDRDGFPAERAMGQCVPSGGCPAGTTTLNPAVAANRDCNDNNTAVRPGATEVCNGIDDNCNGVIDDGLPNGCWNDGDLDTYAPMGAAARCAPSTGCPVGTTSREPTGVTSIDCNDGNMSIRPGGTETCNNVDEDCDTRIDEGLTRACSTACGAGTESCTAGTFGGCTAPMPMPEVCNGLDEDCVGGVDNGLPNGCWADPDGDGYATATAAGRCAPGGGCPAGTTNRDPSVVANRDCLEGNASVNPGASEVCDGLDNNCDGSIVGECGTGCQAATNGGRFYVLCNRTDRDYGQSASDCTSIGTLAGSSGMSLASINSASEQTFILGATQAISASDWWIGLSLTGEPPAWRWADGSVAPQSSSEAPPPHNNWAVGEPDGTGPCARLRPSSAWADWDCNLDLRFVCEGPMP